MARLKKDPATKWWVRPPYQPADYSAPARVIRELLAFPFSTVDELAKYDGAYSNFERVRELDHDGKRWVLLREPADSYLLEVELTTTVPPEIRQVPPEQAWVFARTLDQAAKPPIPFEGDPPPGVTEPTPAR